MSARSWPCSPFLATPPSAAAATAVYYSVGTSGADLKVASTVAIASGLATFSTAQPNNVGVGDRITYNTSTIAYISGRTSSTQYRVTTALGAAPPNIAGATVNSIRRAFGGLATAITGARNPSHLVNGDLVAGNYQLNLACYADGVMSMPSGTEVGVIGYTTDPTHYVRIYTPTSSSEVGVSQRHRGVFGTGFRLEGTNADTIEIQDSYVRIEGLTILATVTDTSSPWGAIWSIPNGASDVRISHNIIKGNVTDAASLAAYGITLGYIGSSEQARVWNNILYNFPVVTGTEGDGISVYYGSGYIFNNTVYNCRDGIRKYNTASATEVKNNVSINDVFDPATFTDLRDLTLGTPATRVSNVSSDATSETLALRSKAAFATYFKNTTAGTEDLHVVNTSLALWGSAGANLSADANLPVTDDIDGGPRMAPDIGADEFGTCCGLATTEVAGSTVTVTGAGQFELRFNAATGGGIDQFFDLAEDPSRTWDLAGGISTGKTLLDTGFGDGPTSYPASQNSTSSRMDLLEATPVRVRVRREALLPGGRRHGHPARNQGVRRPKRLRVRAGGPAMERKDHRLGVLRRLPRPGSLRPPADQRSTEQLDPLPPGGRHLPRRGKHQRVPADAERSCERPDRLPRHAEQGLDDAQRLPHAGRRSRPVQQRRRRVGKPVLGREHGSDDPRGDRPLQPAGRPDLELARLLQAHELREQRRRGRHVTAAPTIGPRTRSP